MATSVFTPYMNIFHSVGGRSGSDCTARTRLFRVQMESVIPWQRLEDHLRPHYYAGRRGRPPMPLMRMLRIHMLQRLHDYSDAQVLEQLTDSLSAMRFCDLDPTADAIPERTVLVKFRAWLDRLGFAELLTEAVDEALDRIGMELKVGTTVDSTLIAASGSTKNQAGKRDPDMSSTKKGNQWHFGMKLHVGVDAETNRIHAAVSTTAKEHDATVLPSLLHGREQFVLGDKAYAGQTEKIRQVAPAALDLTLRKGHRNRPLTAADEEMNRVKSRVRAMVEHPFRVLKCQFGYRRVRYRGLQRNASHQCTLVALINLYQFRKPLMSSQG